MLSVRTEGRQQLEMALSGEAWIVQEASIAHASFDRENRALRPSCMYNKLWNFLIFNSILRSDSKGTLVGMTAH